MNTFKQIAYWWLTLAGLCIPFGFIYGCAHRALGHDSPLAIGVCCVLVLALTCYFRGLPPTE